MRPNHAPLGTVPLIEVGMPVPLTRDVVPLYDDFELGTVPENRHVPVDPNRDRFRLPVEVVDLPGADPAQILLFGEHTAERVDELKVLCVQLSRSFDITCDQRTKSLALR